MEESFPISMAKNILTKIASDDFKAIFQSLGLPKDRTKLEETLRKLQEPLFLVAEEHQAEDDMLRRRFAELSDLLYDAEDVLHVLECRDTRSSTIKAIRKSLCKKEVTISKYLRGLTLWHVYLSYKEINHSFVGTTDVFGRNSDKEDIINLLMQPNTAQDKNFSVICIVGIEGIGKTSLAEQVYTDRRIDDNFQLKLWVRVPNEFARIKLMKECYASATRENYDEVGNNDLAHRLEETLRGMKFFLVLDHVYSSSCQDLWDVLKTRLLKGGDGSKVLVTTRDEKNASKMGAVKSHTLEPLSNGYPLQLFMNSAFGDGPLNRYPQLSIVRDEIVKKCGGVPLALKTLGNLLYQNTDSSDWTLVNNDNNMSKLNEGRNILPALKLSYANLPSHLKRCFASCLLFPKDYHFNSDSLVSCWMAIGLLGTRNANEELEDVGLRYLKQLLSRCFFQENVEGHDYYFTFKMHDTVHVLAEEVGKREYQRLDLRNGFDDQENAQHVSIAGIGNLDNRQKNKFFSRNFRTIIMQSLEDEHSLQIHFIDKCILKFKHIRMLCLSGLAVKKLPDFIGALKHLRFLDLSWNLFMEELTEAICDLKSLQTLRLLGCSKLKKLPSNMRNLISLRYLELSTHEVHLPQNGIERLESLRYLHLHNCRTLAGLPASMQSVSTFRTLILQDCPYLQELPLWMENVTSLRRLEVASCPRLTDLPNGMQNLTALRELKIQNSPSLSVSCRGQNWSNIHRVNVYLDSVFAP